MIRRPPRSTRTDTLFPYTTLFRSHPLLRRCAQAVDSSARPLACVPDPARPARHQPHLGAGAGGAALSGNSIPHLVAPGCHPLGTTTGAGEIAAARRSEERRVGKECVSTCRSRWSPYP